MPEFTFTCPHCKTNLQIHDALAGQAVTCPTCSRSIQIPPPDITAPSAPGSAGTPKTAIWSLVLGILGITCCSVITAIPAIICGHKALSKIKNSAGAFTGSGLALAGLILGYIGLALAIVIIPLQCAIAIPSFVKARNTAQMNACINNIRMLDAAKEQAAMANQWPAGHSIPDGSADLDLVLSYVKGSTMPACPAGGTYEVKAIGETPTCSIPGHEMPE